MTLTPRWGQSCEETEFLYVLKVKLVQILIRMLQFQDVKYNPLAARKKITIDTYKKKNEKGLKCFTIKKSTKCKKTVMQEIQDKGHG